MGEHDPLGWSCGAGGIDQGGECLGVLGLVHHGAALPRQPVAERAHPVVLDAAAGHDAEDPPQGREGRLAPGEGGPAAVRIDQEEPAARVGEDVGQIVGVVGGIEWHHHESEP